MKDSRSTSAVWKYFTCLSSELAQCCLCFRNYSRKGRGTTSLKSHLRSMHKEQYRDLLDFEDQRMKWKEEMAREASLAPPTSSSSSIRSTVDTETLRLQRNEKESSEIQASWVLPSSSTPSSSSSLSSSPPPTAPVLVEQEPPPSSLEDFTEVVKVEVWDGGIFYGA